MHKSIYSLVKCNVCSLKLNSSSHMHIAHAFMYVCVCVYCVEYFTMLYYIHKGLDICVAEHISRARLLSCEKAFSFDIHSFVHSFVK